MLSIEYIIIMDDHHHDEYRSSIEEFSVNLTLHYACIFSEPDTLYEVSLLAFTAHGDSVLNKKSLHTWASDTPEVPRPGSNPSPPPPPSQVDAKPINQSAISVTWRAPDFPEPIMYYTVKYRKVTGYRLLGLDRTDADTETITRYGK